MFIFNPILTIRNLNRQRSTTFINILGFTLGLVAAFFLFFYIQEELTADSFHQYKDQIYRAVRQSDINGTPYNIGVTSGPYAKALENDFPENIIASTRAYPEEGLVAYGEKKFYEEKLLFADANFFEFFSFPLLFGSKETVLSNSNSVVISRRIANKYFGDEDPIGKTLVVDNEYSFVVSGIMDEFPNKSHIDFDVVFSIDLFSRFEWFGNWWNNGLMTYVRIPTPDQAEQVKSQLPNFMQKYFAEDYKLGREVKLTLEPLSDVYFNHESRYDPALHGNKNSIFTLSVVGLAILFIACFNYVNLSIAQSLVRAKEVGVRKVLGVQKTRLILQFLSESMMILVFSILFAIVICESTNSFFNVFFDLTIDLNWLNETVLVFLLSLLILILLTSGLYPAILLSSFRPVSILKGTKLSSGKNVGLRKGLVVIQFAISIFLIVTTSLIVLQTNYLNSKDLGFSKEATILVNINNQDIRSNIDLFKERLLEQSSIREVTSVSGEPGGFHDGTVLQVSGLEGEHQVRTVFTDANYLKVFEVELVAGRDFDQKRNNEDEGSLMINQSAVASLGLGVDDLLGRNFSLPFFSLEGRIVGIVKDFHFSSLKDDIEPLVIGVGGRHRRIAVKANESELAKTVLIIDKIFRELSPNYPMSYDFVDQSLARLYQNEQRQARIFSAFSGISIFLACLGIFGLAAYSAQQRQKELGIRKVLGASIQQIISLISKEFVILVLIAAVIATPVVWYFIDQWLSGFAYRIAILEYWYIFLVSGIVAILIALITVTFKTYRAAIANPTESIRNE